jgi:uncharacterized protein with FMN-binding domain
MSKSILSWAGVALVLAGFAVVTGHPAWASLTVGAVLILAGVSAAIAARIQSRRNDEPSGKRVSNDLVTLSAAAVIAVYAAGFHRTKAAADEFEAQRARRHTPRPIAAEVMQTSPSQAAAAQAPPMVAMAMSSSAQAPMQSPAPAASPQQPALAKNSARPSSGDPKNLSAGAVSAPVAPAAGEASQSEAGPPYSAPAQPAPQTTPAAPVSPQIPATIPGQVPAPASVVAAAGAPVAPASEIPLMPRLKYKDGTFLGWGRSAHGNIQASVVIENGRISTTAIARCETAYSCDWIARLPGQVISRQDPGIDVVSGASDSSYAFQDAVSAALFKAQRGE